MKLTAAQLIVQIQKKLTNIYVVSGDEPVQKNEVIEAIIHAATKQGFSEHIRFLSDIADEATLYAMLYSTSLLANKQIIELDFRRKLPTKSLNHLLQTYLEKPDQHQLMIFHFNKLEAKTLQNTWYKTIEALAAKKEALIFASAPLTYQQQAIWLNEQAKRRGLLFEKNVLETLTTITEGNLIAAKEAIEKLDLFAMNAPITLAMLQEIMQNESRYTLFTFSDAVIKGDVKKTLHYLNMLKEEGIELTLLLWALTREIRMLANFKTALRQGDSFLMLCKKHRIFSYREESIKRCVTKYSEENIATFLLEAASIDRAIKYGKENEAWHKLQLLCLAFQV